MAELMEELREKVAVSCRILAMEGLVDEILGHVSVRIAGADELLRRSVGFDWNPRRAKEPIERSPHGIVVIDDEHGCRVGAHPCTPLPTPGRVKRSLVPGRSGRGSAVIDPPCFALRSFESSGRDDQTALTCAFELALMAAICAVAAHPYPMTATLNCFGMIAEVGGRFDGSDGSAPVTFRLSGKPPDRPGPAESSRCPAHLA